MLKKSEKSLIKFFGQRWKKFDQEPIKTELKKIFDIYFGNFPFDKINKKSVGIDIGSGTGRWAQFILPKVKKLYCLEPSNEAISISKIKLSKYKNCIHLNKEANDIFEIEDHSLDFAYSLGVLHHITDINKAMHSFSIKLKDRAPVLLYLYYNLETRGIIYRLISKLINIIRIIISRMPSLFKFIISDFFAIFIYFPLSRFAKFISYLGINTSRLPLSFYKDYSFYTLRSDSLDRFGTIIEKRYTKDDIIKICNKFGIKNLVFNKNQPYWTVCGEFDKNLYYENLSNKKTNMLIICPYPYGKMASQRLKYEQHINFLKEKNFTITVSSFFDLQTWNVLYKKGYIFRKIIGTLKGYFFRNIIINSISNFDIVYVHMWVVPFGKNFYEKIFRNNSKILIYDIEDNLLINSKSDINPINHYLRSNKKYIYLIENSDHVITSAPDLNDLCLNISKKNNSTFIPPGIDLNRYITSPTNVNENNLIAIGWTGTFSSIKYLKVLEKIFTKLAKKINFKLVIIGNFEYNLDGLKTEMIQWKKETEIEDLSKIDIGVYPLMKNEKWVYGKSGLKALQYMAMGIPSVSTNIGNVKNFIVNGHNGFLVNDDNEWEKVLYSLLKDSKLRKKIGVNARKTIEDSYSNNLIREKYYNILKKY